MEMLRLENAYTVPHAVDMLTLVIYDLWKQAFDIAVIKVGLAQSVHCPEMIQFKIPI